MNYKFFKTYSLLVKSGKQGASLPLVFHSLLCVVLKNSDGSFLLAFTLLLFLPIFPSDS
jgi:hypothetical protein